MGMAVFMNSVSRGVVSNVAGRRDDDASLFVTDARSVPGCEGGALYAGTYPHKWVERFYDAALTNLL